MQTKIKFTGSFGEYFIMSLGLMLLSIITFGLAFPYWAYWSYKYFFTKMQVGEKRVKFTGGFGEYFIMSLGLFLLSIITFGLAFPYWIYWMFKYFFTRLEVMEAGVQPIQVHAQNQPQHIPDRLSADTDSLFD